jgi:hypothetical protein
MSIVYVFEGSVIKISRERCVIYPPREYQEKLSKFHGERVKVIVVKEGRVSTCLELFRNVDK